MMNKCKLGDLLELKHGFAFKSANYVKKSEYALITLGNISDKNNFQFFPDKATYYGASFPKEFILKENDLIMPLTEQTPGLFGNSAFIPKYDNLTFVLNQRVAKVIPKEGKSNVFYLHYLLSSREVRIQLENRANGTKQRNISPEDVYDVTVYVPNYGTQEKIGKFLYFIEEKINNNLKIIDKVENNMILLFNIWFNLYKYPVNGKMNINSDIERKWKKRKLENIMNYFSGYPFSSSYYESNGKYKLYTIGNVQDGFIDSYSNSYFNKLPANMPNNCLLKPGDIIMSLTGNVGRVGIVFEENVLLNQRLLKIDEKGIYSKSFLYFFLRTEKMSKLMINYAHGTSQKNLSPIDLAQLQIEIPEEKIVERFKKVGDKSFELICNKYIENNKLDNLRKYLVPLLLNGQISIEE